MPHAAVNGTEIFYDIVGQGEPVVLLPGLGLDHTYYAHALPYLAQSVKVIALDLRGIGRSAKPEGPYTVELWAEDINALLDTLGERHAHIVGSSLGGCVAIAFASKYPEKVKSLTLVASFAEVDRAMEINFRMRIAIVEQLGVGEVQRDHVSIWTLSRHFIETDKGKIALDGVLSSLSQNTPALYAEFCRALLRVGRVLPEQAGQPKFSEHLPHLTMPTLVIVGDKDFLTPPEFSQKMVSLLPNAEFVVLKECGHITFVEQPEENTHLVVEFVRKTTETTVQPA